MHGGRNAGGPGDEAEAIKKINAVAMERDTAADSKNAACGFHGVLREVREKMKTRHVSRLLNDLCGAAGGNGASKAP